MSDYTPTTEDVEFCFVGEYDPEMRSRAFHRWIAAHDREVRAQALREAAYWLDGFEGPRGHTSAYDRAGRDIIRLLRERATKTKEDR